MKRDFAISLGSQLMAALLKLTLNSFVIIEFAVDNDVQIICFIGDRLIPCC
jgi:hypothetical protein